MKKLIKKNEEISGITLIFENCEVMTIPSEYIDWLLIGTINQDIVFNGIVKQTSCNLSADSLEVSIKNSFLKEYDNEKLWFDENIDAKDRLKWNDITGISLIVNKKGIVGKKLENLGKTDSDDIYSAILEKGKTIDIYVPWEASDDYVNNYQKFNEGSKVFNITIKKEEE
ncbi:hypothetical protein [Levilactobacillus phage ENFP1]|nr:hypothetical protein [Levilactobacillus phage ENFP1]